MQLNFKVKIDEEGNFKLPVAKPVHSSEARHTKAPIQFKMAARKLIKQNLERKAFFIGGHFNMNNLPDKITLGEVKFITDVTVEIK